MKLGVRPGRVTLVGPERFELDVDTLDDDTLLQQLRDTEAVRRSLTAVQSATVEALERRRL